jgi:dTMP kinase
MSFFITFEGIEGSGKTTQVQHLFDFLQTQGFQVVVTREPGGCTMSDAIRTMLLNPENCTMSAHTELLLYSAARAQHVSEVIRPALNEGKVVLCDRFTDATTVYQGVGRGLDASILETINSFATEGLTPDLTLILDCPVESGLPRARARNRNDNLEAEGRFEQEALAFHERIRQGYLDLASGQDRFCVINALGDEGAVAERITAAVVQFLRRRRSA